MDDELEVPFIPDAPGLRLRIRNKGIFEAFWRARADIVKMGFEPKNRLLWKGKTPTDAEVAFMQDTCRRLQDEMLVFGRGGLPKPGAFDGTLRGLIGCYQTDSYSSYHKLRYHVRVRHDYTMKRIVKMHGHHVLADIGLREIVDWHKQWGGDGTRIAAAHSMVGQLRTLFSFGARYLRNEDCKRLGFDMHGERFPMSKPRTERMTAEQATAIRAKAHEMGWPSIALAQAFQFECMLRQKDVIGEWVPLREPGTTDVTHHVKGKWLRGIRWNEIDENLILRHVTSKRDKELVFDLRLAPMVIEELSILAHYDPGKKTGPIITADTNGYPYTASEFRRKWRLVANAAGIPKAIRSMDSRAGGITEATDAGADLEHVRHAATHSNISMTQKYSRGAAEKVANVMQIRAAHRNKKGSDQS